MLRKVRSLSAMGWHTWCLADSKIIDARLQAKVAKRHITAMKRLLLTSLVLRRSHNIAVKAWDCWRSVLINTRAQGKASEQHAAAQDAASKQEAELHRLRSALDEVRRQASEQRARAEHNAALLEHCRDVCAQQQAELEVLSADHEDLRRASDRRHKAATASKVSCLIPEFFICATAARPSSYFPFYLLYCIYF